MRIRLDAELVALLRDEATTKVLATVDADGVPHAAAKGFLTVSDEGDLVRHELLECLPTARYPSAFLILATSPGA